MELYLHPTLESSWCRDLLSTGTALLLDVVVFWVATPYSVVFGYQHFRGPYCLHLQHGPLKCWYPSTSLHVVTTQKTSTYKYSSEF